MRRASPARCSASQTSYAAWVEMLTPGRADALDDLVDARVVVRCVEHAEHRDARRR